MVAEKFKRMQSERKIRGGTPRKKWGCREKKRGRCTSEKVVMQR